MPLTVLVEYIYLEYVSKFLWFMDLSSRSMSVLLLFYCVAFILLDWLILAGKEKKRKSIKWEFFLYRARHSDLHVNNKNLELLPLQSLPYHNSNRFFFSVVPTIWRLQSGLADLLHLFQSQVNSDKLFSRWTLTGCQQC